MSKATTPTVEESLALLATVQKQLAGHRLPVLKEIADRLPAADLPGLASAIEGLLPLMPEDMLRTSLASFVPALKQFPDLIKASVAVAEAAEKASA